MKKIEPKRFPEVRTTLYYLQLVRRRLSSVNPIINSLQAQFAEHFDGNIVDYCTLANLVKAMNDTAAQEYERLKTKADGREGAKFQYKPISVKLDASDPADVQIYPYFPGRQKPAAAGFTVHVRRVPRVRIHNLKQFINACTASQDCASF